MGVAFRICFVEQLNDHNLLLRAVETKGRSLSHRVGTGFARLRAYGGDHPSVLHNQPEQLLQRLRASKTPDWLLVNQRPAEVL